MRLIDANALIAEQCGQCDGACEMFDVEKCLACKVDCHCDLREAIDAADTIDYVPRQQWISVKERLPGKHEDVLIFSYLCGTQKAFYEGDGEFDCSAGYSLAVGNVTHWMPLPKDPKEDER